MIIWLASYPKSGNTWVRSMIATLMYTDNGVFNFDLLQQIKQFPSKNYFTNFTNDFGNIHEIKKYWESAQDPRNLVTSISNHYSKSLEDSKNFLLSPRFLTGFKKDGDLEKDSLKTLLGTWGEHYKFWKNNNENFLLIKYEDLINNTYSELNKIITFIKKFTPIQTNEIKNENIIKTTSFNHLKNLEEKGNFNENAYETIDKKKKFFNLGPENNWENILDKKIKDEIEAKLSSEMKELEYLS